MKKTLSIVLALVMMIGIFAGCGGNSDTSSATQSETAQPVQQEGRKTETVAVAEKVSKTSDESVTIALGGEPNTLIPAIKFNGNNNVAIERLIYEPFIASSWPTEPNGSGLCVSWEWIDDTHLRLHLREGVKFANGEEFNADDVLYQMTQGMSGLMYDTFLPDECTKEDDYTVVLALAQPWGQAVDILCTGNMLAIEDTALKAAGGKGTTQLYLEGAGTGKYVMKEWKQGEYILLTRNENYWDVENPGYFKEIKFVFLSDSTANGLAAQSGDVDISAAPSLANYAVYEADNNVKIVFVNSNNVSTLFLNSGNGGVLEDINVRKAVECLIDANAIRQVAQYGFGDLCNTIIAPQNPYYDADAGASDHTVNIEKAKEYLKAAGYENGVTLRLRQGAGSSIVSDLIQEQLRLGGIEVEIVTADQATHFAALAQGDYDMYVSSQQAVYYSEALRCTDGLGWTYSDLMGGCSYKDEEWHEIVTRCLQETSPTAKAQAMSEYQQMFKDKCVSVALYTGSGISVCRPDIEGISLFGVGTLDFSNVYSSK